MPGTVGSPIEVVQLTPHGVWLAYHDQFPGFRDATASRVFNLQEISPEH